MADQPLTPPQSPIHRRAITMSGIRRASLNLSPSWDHRTQSCRHLGDLDDDDLIKVAYFPLDESLPKGLSLHRKNKEFAKSDDEWSTASVTSETDSIYSHHEGENIWSDVPMGPADAILGIASAYRACNDPRKVNVCVGAYRDDSGKPYVLPTVRAAEKILWEDNEVKEYLPIEGDKDFIEEAMKFAYGKNMDIEGHVAAVQTLSGTGACAIGGRFLEEFWPSHPIYVPNPTWGNHIAIFKQCGLECRKYRYYNREKNCLDIDGMIRDLSRARDGSIILLHACAHNPTGCDPTMEQWKEIISLISQKQHIAFFDSAYQGFGKYCRYNWNWRGMRKHDLTTLSFSIGKCRE